MRIGVCVCVCVLNVFMWVYEYGRMCVNQCVPVYLCSQSSIWCCSLAALFVVSQQPGDSTCWQSPGLTTSVATFVSFSFVFLLRHLSFCLSDCLPPCLSGSVPYLCSTMEMALPLAVSIPPFSLSLLHWVKQNGGLPLWDSLRQSVFFYSFSKPVRLPLYMCMPIILFLFLSWEIRLVTGPGLLNNSFVFLHSWRVMLSYVYLLFIIKPCTVVTFHPMFSINTDWNTLLICVLAQLNKCFEVFFWPCV